MNIIKKVVNPCKCERGQAFCEINIIDGKLSIHGVIGPTNGGNCKGASGQCQDEIKESMMVGYLKCLRNSLTLGMSGI